MNKKRAPKFAYLPVGQGNSRPSLSERIEDCIEEGNHEIILIPVTPLPKKVLCMELPESIRTAKRRYPHVDFHYVGKWTSQR